MNVSSFQVLVGADIIIYAVGQLIELLLCRVGAMCAELWLLKKRLVSFFLLLVYIFLVHPDRMRKWGLISLDGRWIDFRSLWLRSMSPAITISDRFRSVMSLREFWPAASNPSSRAFNPLPLFIQPLILLGHGPPPGAHYLIENYSARRVLVSNYRCACVSKNNFFLHHFIFLKRILPLYAGLIKSWFSHSLKREDMIDSVLFDWFHYFFFIPTDPVRVFLISLRFIFLLLFLFGR